MKLKIDSTYCPVCGYNWEKPIFNFENDRLYFSAEVTGEICPSCGSEFDYNLFPNEESYLKNRIRWIKNGMLYTAGSLQKKFPATFHYPENWNPIKQLKNINVNLLDPRVMDAYSKEVTEIKTIIKKYKSLK